MAQLVYDQLVLALQGMETLEAGIPERVFAIDEKVNETRYAIEARCFRVIATQQPTARDLRFLIAAMNIIIDLERVGDKAKDIAESFRQLQRSPKTRITPEQERMSKLVSCCSKAAFRSANDDIVHANHVIERDTELAPVRPGLNQTIEHAVNRRRKRRSRRRFG